MGCLEGLQERAYPLNKSQDFWNNVLRAENTEVEICLVMMHSTMFGENQTPQTNCQAQWWKDVDLGLATQVFWGKEGRAWLKMIHAN